jgi:hypothetical protein
MSNLIASPDMVAALRADGPMPSLASELALFGQFVGAWNLEIDFWPREEPPWSTDGLWLFDWILDGRGIQDVILHTTRAGRRRQLALRTRDARQATHRRDLTFNPFLI